MSLATLATRVEPTTGFVGARRVTGRTSSSGGTPVRIRRRRRPCMAVGVDNDAQRTTEGLDFVLAETRENTIDSHDTACSCQPSTRARSPWPVLDALDDAREVLAHELTQKQKTNSHVETLHWTVSVPFPEPTPVTTAVARTTGLSQDLANELVDMGAVYAEVWPEGRDPPGDGQGDGTIDSMGSISKAEIHSFQAFGWSRVDGVSPPATVPPPKRKQKWIRVKTHIHGLVIEQNQRIRVHVNPRRYRDGCWLGELEWRKRVVFENADFFVVNKPARLPTQAHESNGCECVPGCVERSLGLIPGSLHVTHRLDASTSGVVVLGKHKAAVAAFNDAVANKSSKIPKPKTTEKEAPKRVWRGLAKGIGGVGEGIGGIGSNSGGEVFATQKNMTKTYVALTSGTSNLLTSRNIKSGSTVVHWMYPGPFGDDALSGFGVKKSEAKFLQLNDAVGETVSINGFERKTRWKRCELRVVRCREVDDDTVQRWHESHAESLQSSHKALPKRWIDRNTKTLKPPKQVFEITVELITGRTHQVRAQLAALGHPILGDSLYEPMRGYLHDEGGDFDQEEGDTFDQEEGDAPKTFEKKTHLRKKKNNKDAAVAKRIGAGVVPDWPVALHARSLVWEEYTFEAPAPWAKAADEDHLYL